MHSQAARRRLMSGGGGQWQGGVGLCAIKGRGPGAEPGSRFEERIELALVNIMRAGRRNHISGEFWVLRPRNRLRSWTMMSYLQRTLASGVSPSEQLPHGFTHVVVPLVFEIWCLSCRYYFVHKTAWSWCDAVVLLPTTWPCLVMPLAVLEMPPSVPRSTIFGGSDADIVGAIARAAATTVNMMIVLILRITCGSPFQVATAVNATALSQSGACAHTAKNKKGAPSLGASQRLPHLYPPQPQAERG